MGEAVSRILVGSRRATERPAYLICFVELNNINDILEALQYTNYDDAVSPRAGIMDVQNVSARFRREVRVRIC